MADVHEKKAFKSNRRMFTGRDRYEHFTSRTSTKEKKREGVVLYITCTTEVILSRELEVECGHWVSASLYGNQKYLTQCPDCWSGKQEK